MSEPTSTPAVAETPVSEKPIEDKPAEASSSAAAQTEAKPETAPTDSSSSSASESSSTISNPFAAPAHNPFAAFTGAVAAPASSSSEEKTEEEEHVTGADSTAIYEPVVKLDRVEIATGEEDDEEFYKQRAVLYRFDPAVKEWKERGRGDVKFLQNKETGKIRILLRQEKTLKVCCNHLIHPLVELKPNAGSDRSWTWACTDYASEQAENQTFAIRLKDADIANAFKAKYDEARKLNEENAAH